MDDEFTEKILPVNVDRQLDELLDIWAGHVRMSPLEKEDIYNQIFVNTEDFGYDWWRKLLDHSSIRNTNIFVNLRYGNKNMA